jgi:hypothetical protein
MTEWETPKPKTAEQVGNRLLEFVGNTEFGTPEYQAVSDYLHLKQLEESLKIEQRNTLSKDDDPEGKMHWESQARITEQEIAIHRSQIYQRQSQVKGYDGSYTHVGIGFEFDLVDAARKEAQRLYPQDPTQQDFYKSEIQSQYFGKAESIIDQKSSNNQN